MRFFYLRSTALALALAAMPAAAMAGPNASLAPLTASETFPAWQSTIQYQLPTTGGPSGFGNFARATSTVRYDHATQSYVIRQTGSASSTYTFGPSDIVSSNTTYTVYSRTIGGTTHTLRMLNPGAANPLIQLSYVTYGAWRQSTPGGAWNGATAASDTYLVFGVRTPSASMPHSGSGTYNGHVDGTFVNKDAVYAVTGASQLTANFASGTISYWATPTGTPTSGANLNFGTVSGTGTIAFGSSGFTGNPDNLNPNYQMSLNGNFYGPAAQEIGAVFRLTSTARNGGTGTGAFVGKQ
jgi:hypothetical protein